MCTEEGHFLVQTQGHLVLGMFVQICLSAMSVKGLQTGSFYTWIKIKLLATLHLMLLNDLQVQFENVKL